MKDRKIDWDYIVLIIIIIVMAIPIVNISALMWRDTAGKSSDNTCDLLYGEDDVFTGIDPDSIKAEKGLVEYTVSGKKRILSVDKNYAIICK